MYATVCGIMQVEVMTVLSNRRAGNASTTLVEIEPPLLGDSYASLRITFSDRRQNNVRNRDARGPRSFQTFHSFLAAAA